MMRITGKHYTKPFVVGTQIVKYLIGQGADTKWKVGNGGGALWLAKQTLPVNHEIIQYLLSVGATEEEM